jgi:hypothetical protein
MTGEHREAGGTRRRTLIPCVAAACGILLAGCGSTRPAKPAAAPTTPGSTAGSTTASGTGQVPGNGEAAKPPAQIVADAAASVRTAHSYRVRGNVTTTRIDATIESATAFDLTLGQGPAAFELIEVAGGSYLRANAAFLRQTHAGALAPGLSGRWIPLPPSTTGAFAKDLDVFTQATLARCLVEGHGTLRVAGAATIAGQPTVVVKDAGDAPGTQPTTLYVAATGPPYPLRITGTGHMRAGGRIDVCNDGKASDAGGSVTFSEFDATPPVRPPVTAAAPAPAQPQGA